MDDRAVPPLLSGNPLRSNARSIGAGFGEDLGDEFFQAGAAGDRRKMTHQRRAEAMSLIVVGHREGKLGPARAHDHVTSASHESATTATRVTKSTFTK